ncbi:MAG: rRNA maturation RNase YbeY [Ruminiclostridium sp.]|nr:rRNA maturation RNase YbeY [Ruminiclostridium sp.]
MITVRVFGTNRQRIVPVSRELRTIVKHSISETLYEEGYKGDFEVSVTFTDNEGIRAINKEYRDIDRETDVLSFPMTDADEEFTVDPETECYMLGDIVISLEKALSQSEEYGHSFKREVAFLTVHSMLHLLGYDHERSEAEEQEMFGKQELVLEAMGLGR